MPARIHIPFPFLYVHNTILGISVIPNAQTRTDLFNYNLANKKIYVANKDVNGYVDSTLSLAIVEYQIALLR